MDIHNSIEARRFPGLGVDKNDELMALVSWLVGQRLRPPSRWVRGKFEVPTADGPQEVREGDWIYRCQHGGLIVVRHIDHFLPAPVVAARRSASSNSLGDRDPDMDPYRPDERRVVEYLLEIAPDIGAGDDPIGFLIASHRVLSARRPTETPLPAADLPAVDEPRVPRRPPLGGDPMRPTNGDRDPRCGGRPHP